MKTPKGWREVKRGKIKKGDKLTFFDGETFTETGDHHAGDCINAWLSCGGKSRVLRRIEQKPKRKPRSFKAFIDQEGFTSHVGSYARTPVSVLNKKVKITEVL